MGIKTVAESVESEDILAALLLVGVDFAQGFHLGRPLPLLELLGRAAAPSLPQLSMVVSVGGTGSS